MPLLPNQQETVTMDTFLRGLWEENPVFVMLLGMCPVLAVTNSTINALAIGLATTFVLTLSSATAYLLYRYVLLPLDLEYLRTIGFILIIAASVQFTEIMVRRMSPLLDQVLGIFIPLIATNCAVLGVALLNVQQSKGFVQSVFFGVGASLGFALVLVLFAALRERLAAADVPAPFRGPAIGMITAGLMSLAFMGFTGLV